MSTKWKVISAVTLVSVLAGHLFLYRLYTQWRQSTARDNRSASSDAPVIKPYDITLPTLPPGVPAHTIGPADSSAHITANIVRNPSTSDAASKPVIARERATSAPASASATLAQGPIKAPEPVVAFKPDSAPALLIHKGWKPAWHPNGKTLLFVREGINTVAMLDLATGAQSDLIENGKDAVFSPNGSQIAFVRINAAENNREEVWNCDARGGSQHFVTVGGYPCWTPDGDGLLFHSHVEQKLAWISATEQGATSETIFDGATSLYPAFSPDVSRIAAGQTADGSSTLTVVDRFSKSVKFQTTINKARGLFADFSPGGGLLAAGGFDGDPSGLWIADLKTNRSARVLDGPFTGPAWSRDGSMLAFDRRDGTTRDIWTMSTNFALDSVVDPIDAALLRGERAPAVTRIVCICDADAGMNRTFDTLRAELTDLIKSLHPMTRFDVVIIRDGDAIAAFPELVASNPANSRRLVDFVDGIAPLGSNNPRPAFDRALALRPELIYFLTTGTYPNGPAISDYIRTANAMTHVKINVVLFGRPSPDPKMPETFARNVSNDSGGTYRIVTSVDRMTDAPITAPPANATPMPAAGLKPSPLTANEQRHRAILGAMRVARDQLFAHQRDGHWELAPVVDQTKGPFAVEGGQFGGLTALATLSLLKSGESPREPHVHAAIEFLKKTNVNGVYALGVRTQVWNFLPPAEARPLVDRDAKQLLLAVKGNVDERGFFDYLAGPSARYDHSASQFGVLGMQAAADAQPAFEILPKFWEVTEFGWMRDQDKSGAWSYTRAIDPAHPLTMSMTAAGVATLLLARDYYHARESIPCKGNSKDPEIEAGIRWMTDNFNLIGMNLYTWYGVERVGLAAGIKRFGEIDWYREGCKQILANKSRWSDFGSVPGTSLALIFMSAGETPVAFNKLSYTLAGAGGNAPAAHWDQRSSALPNAVRWISRETQSAQRWQIVKFDDPLEDWQESPVLFITGDQPLNFGKTEEARLRRYVEDGGLILLNADCGKSAFTDSVMKSAPGRPSLAKRLFPDFEWRTLPGDHDIYTHEMFQKNVLKGPLGLSGVSNGSRELMLMFTGADPTRDWQTQAFAGHEASFQLMTDIFLYAIDKSNTRYRGSHDVVTDDAAKNAGRTLKVARLQYPGIWNPEPGGWRRLSAIEHNEDLLALSIEPVNLGQAQLTNAYQVAHLTGNFPYHWNDKQVAELKAFVGGGGLLIVDCCGGNKEFAACLEPMFAGVFGDDAKQLQQPLPPDDPIFLRPHAVEIAYRRAAERAFDGKLKTPQLRAIVRNGKPACYYSPQDLSTGLVGHEVDGINGYAPDCATNLMRHILARVTVQ